MAGLFYYLPGCAKPTADEADLKALGLGHAITSKGLTSLRVDQGPDQGKGLIVVPEWHGAPRPHRHAEGTEWRKGTDGKWWVGYVNDSRPEPMDLVRSQVYDGQVVRLRDGREWIIPRCHAVLEDRPITLPRVLDLDASATTWQARPAPEFEALCVDAYGIWSCYISQENDLEASEQIRIAVDALGANYRIGPVEAALLQLLGTQEIGKILRAMIDADEIERRAIEIAKKKASPLPDTSNT